MVNAGSFRKTVSLTNRLNALEGWRGIACLMIFLYHCGINLSRPPIAIFGFSGVHMFFVLSGYLLFRPYAAAIANTTNAPDTCNFYLRRLLRILPPYWVALFVFVTMRVATKTNAPTIWSVFTHATLLFNYSPRIDFYSINAVFWSLAIEAQFYLLLPLICLTVMKLLNRSSPGKQLTAIIMITFVVGLAARSGEVWGLQAFYNRINNTDHVRYRSVFAFLDFFCSGMLVAALQTLSVGERVRGPRSNLIGLAAICVGLIVFFAANDWCAIAAGGTWQSAGPASYLILFPVLSCAGVAMILFGVVSTDTIGPSVLRWCGLRRLGEISYSLYLYHTGVQFFIFKLRLFESWSWNAMTIGNAGVALVPAIACASMMFYIVERPSLMLVARVRDRQKSSASVGEPKADGGAPQSRVLQEVSLLSP